MATVTVTRKKPKSGFKTDAITGASYVVTFSALPGQTFGPWSFAETVTDLRISALLPAVEARNLVLDAFVSDSATKETR